MPPPTDPRWPELLSLASHELRTPLTVANGYLRMVLTGRAGDVSDQQQRHLQDVQKSLGRIKDLLDELSDLAKLGDGRSSLQRQPADLHALLRSTIDELPPLPDRTVTVELDADGPAPVQVDAPRIGRALGAITMALRREVVTSDTLRVRLRRRGDWYEILVGDDEAVRLLDASARDADLPPFDEFRGGSGMSLAIARYVLDAHGGHVHAAPQDQRAGAKIMLPAV